MNTAEPTPRESAVDLRNRRQAFGKHRSLSQYAVSLPSQPEDVSVIHPHDAEFNFFKKGRDFQSNKAKHHYTADELQVLATYESADNLPSHTEVYRQWLEDTPPRQARHQLTWGTVAIVGTIIGIIAFLVKQVSESFQIFRNPFIGGYIERGESYRLWMYHAFISCSLAGVSAMLCVYICPFAAGSGLPELIGILNGVVVRSMLSFKTLFYKIISCVLTVLSGLPVGVEGPMVHIGAMVGASLARPANPHCPCQRAKLSQAKVDPRPNFFIGEETGNAEPKLHKGCVNICRYRDCKERHNLICMGAAAGVASAFSAPITGLLFAMEEMSSFWTARLTWQTFVCCILARSVNEIFHSVYATVMEVAEGHHQGSILEFSESALFDTKETVKLNLIIIVPTIILGVVGGLFGALFIFLYLKFARFRRKTLARINNAEVLSAVRVLEPVLVALICSLIIMGSLQLFTCRPLEHSVAIYNKHEGKFLRFHEFQCEVKLHVNFTKDRVDQTGEYNEFATLVFGSWEQMIRNLLSRKTANVFTEPALCIILMFFLIFTTWSSLCFIANGLLIPQLAIGALYGRLFGQILYDLFAKADMTPEEAEAYEWMDPGVFALLGMASFLAGTVRLPVTSVVMLIEMTNDINTSLLIMITVMVSKFVGDRFTHPLYHSLLEFKCIPYLEDDLKVYKGGKLINLELFKASDVMASPVQVVNVHESLQTLANLLLDTNHGAFPVVQPGFGFGRTFLGVITRLELTILLTKTEGFKFHEIQRDDMDRLRISYPEYSSSKLKDTTVTNDILNNFAENTKYEGVRVNLMPYINTSAYSVQSQFSLHRAYSIFRTLGARHLIVTDSYNQVMGIITRKDLMGFVVDDKIKAILAKREGNGRPPGDFSPKCMLNCFRGNNEVEDAYTPVVPNNQLNENGGDDPEETDFFDSDSVPQFRPKTTVGRNLSSTAMGGGETEDDRSPIVRV